MVRASRVIRSVVALAIVVFIVMVVWGVFTALDAAPHASILTTQGAANNSAADAADQNASESGGADAWGSAGNTAFADGTKAGGDTDADGSKPSQTDTFESKPSILDAASRSSEQVPDASSNSSGGATSTPTPSAGGASSASNTGGGSSPDTSAPVTPERTWVSAWDEWVVEGHWETQSIPATYGERAVYGSICNDCGANISGKASAHLKATHHSGFHEGAVGYETYEITPARTEQVWVDTSHWVHHEGYWAD